MRKLITALLLCLLLTACSSGEPKTEYSLSEIYKDQAYGFYVKSGDTFYPVKPTPGGEGYRWYAGKIKCPKVTDETPLVAVYNTNIDMPMEYYITRYDSLGYTIGSHISIGEDQNSLWMDTDDMCEGSDIQVIIDAEDFDSVVEVESINKQKPLSNVDTDVNILTGLEENKYYDLSIYTGTRNLKASICADTEVFKSRGITTLETPLIKTQEKYFIVNLPKNLKKGYYSINEDGMFTVGGNK